MVMKQNLKQKMLYALL
jgi:hypothetical protein